MLSVATQQASPLITVGYEKNKNARVIKATLKIFIPVPPKISLAKITAKAQAMAKTQSGQPTGTIRGTIIPVTR